MSKYNHSTHRNDKAEPNRVTDNRHLSDRENDDNEQMPYLNQWRIDHPDGDNFRLMALALLIVIISALCLFIMSRANADTVAFIKFNGGSCTVCHFEKVAPIKNLHAYKDFHKADNAEKARILAELQR